MNVFAYFTKFSNNQTIKNVISLYVVKISSMLIPLLTLPILAKRLNKDDFGTMLYGQYLGSLLAVVLDFGFLYTATRRISHNRDSPAELSTAVATIQISKLLLFVLFALLSCAAYFVIPEYHSNPLVITLFVFSFAFQQLSPLWFFQGVEKINIYAGIEFFGRIALLLGTVFLVSRQGGSTVYASVFLSSAIFVMIFTNVIMYRSVSLKTIGFAEAFGFLKHSTPMFVMRLGAAMYMAAPAVALGLWSSSLAVANYGGAERIFRASAAMLSPINDAIFPRMSYLFDRNKDDYKRWLRLSMIALLVISTLATGLLYLLAPLMVELLLGNEYVNSIKLIRILCFAIPAIAVGSYAGIQVLLAAGRDILFTSIVFIAGIINLGTLWFFIPKFTETGAAISVVLAEWIVCLLCYFFAQRIQKGETVK